jgi:amidase
VLNSLNYPGTLSRRGEVAQSVEHTAENRGVAGSIPALAISPVGTVAAMELAFLPATEQARLVAEREVSSVELVQLYLDRIEQLDPELNAFVTVRGEAALQDAHASDERGGDAPFRGVPTAVKDLTPTAGIRTTYSSRALADNVPDFDTAVVRRLRDAGFVILGKTNTPEFGTVAFTESELNGATRNPWNPALTPGGSSGGAAAAVAAGLVPVAHGTDGGGSIRIPASCCGLFGLKPSRGRVSTAPFSSLEGLSTSGPITRSVADAAALLDVLAGYELGDAWWAPPPERPFAKEPGTPPGRLRIAGTTTPPNEAGVDAECAAALTSAVALLEELGHEVTEATPPWTDSDLIDAFLAVWQVSPTLYPVDPELLTPLNRSLVESARAFSAADYANAVLRLQAASRRIVGFWRDVDIVVTPTLALPPVPIGWQLEGIESASDQLHRNTLFTPFTSVANVTGLPAMTVPLYWSEAGLPIGVQAIGPPAGDALLLRLAAQLEQARPWAAMRPPIS